MQSENSKKAVTDNTTSTATQHESHVIKVNTNLKAGCFTRTCAHRSDRHLKENVTAVSSRQVLEAVVNMR